MITLEELRKYFDLTYAAGDISIENGLVSCSGNVYLKKKPKIETLPVKFKSVGGDFSCSYNQLTSLAGAPQTVGDNFGCNNNQLTSLAGAPQSVGGNFLCNNNQLTSLAGAPQSVGGGFKCSFNQLTSLAGAPQSVGGNFLCNNNQLTSLAGAPRYIQGKFWLSYAKNLPLLPLLKIKGCDKVEFFSIQGTTNQDLSEILNRYLGKGTRGMLSCAMEMIKAGYGSNARL